MRASTTLTGLLPTHASIGVDSENPSGAARLYRNLGFLPCQRVITHQIEL